MEKFKLSIYWKTRQWKKLSLFCLFLIARGVRQLGKGKGPKANQETSLGFACDQLKELLL